MSAAWARCCAIVSERRQAVNECSIITVIHTQPMRHIPITLLEESKANGQKKQRESRSLQNSRA
jgi:hypothetical protein